MNLQAFQRLARRLEPAITVLLLLAFLGISLPPSMSQLLKAASYGILGILVIGSWKRFIYVSTRDILLLLLLGASLTSILWSAAPDYTLNEVKALVRSTVFGAYLATRYSFKEQIRLWAWVFGLTIFLSLIVGIGPIDVPWRGIFAYKNHLAKTVTFAAILFLTTALKRGKQNWFAWFGFGIAAVLIFLSQSKSAYLIFGVLVCMFPLYKVVMQHYKVRVVLLSISLLLGGSAIVLLLGNLETILVDILGKSLTFSGRTDIWDLMFDKIRERPWFGYGYAGFWTSDEAFYVLDNSWALTGAGGANAGVRFNAHNSFLEVLLQLGWVGLSLYIVNFFLLFIRSIRLFNSTLKIDEKIAIFWMFQSLVAIFLFSWSDSGGILGAGSMWSFYVAISLSTLVQQHRIRKQYHLSTAIKKVA
ncbi:MAG: O-antigen ligase family protein [Calothrix sp. MO_192.B10]|nr:O-antigen ligase family protein [Calothrix sp. MO_192.B10]